MCDRGHSQGIYRCANIVVECDRYHINFMFGRLVLLKFNKT